MLNFKKTLPQTAGLAGGVVAAEYARNEIMKQGGDISQYSPIILILLGGLIQSQMMKGKNRNNKMIEYFAMGLMAMGAKDLVEQYAPQALPAENVPSGIGKLVATPSFYQQAPGAFVACPSLKEAETGKDVYIDSEGNAYTINEEKLEKILSSNMSSPTKKGTSNYQVSSLVC